MRRKTSAEIDKDECLKNNARPVCQRKIFRILTIRFCLISFDSMENNYYDTNFITTDRFTVIKLGNRSQYYQ